MIFGLKSNHNEWLITVSEASEFSPPATPAVVRNPLGVVLDNTKEKDVEEAKTNNKTEMEKKRETALTYTYALFISMPYMS